MFKRLNAYLAPFDREGRTVILIIGLFSLAANLSGLFVNVYLWKVQHSLSAVAWFNLSSWTGILLWMPVAGAMGKRLGAARPMQLGLVGQVIFYGTLLALQERAVHYLIPLGLLSGTAVAFYALGQNTLNYEVTRDHNLDRFLGVTGFLSAAAALIGPLAAGGLIGWLGTALGYRLIFGTSFGLFALCTLLGFWVRTRAGGGRLELGRVLLHPPATWRRALIATGITGIREVYTFLMNLLIFSALGSEAALGQWGMVTGLLSLVVYAWLGKRVLPHNRTHWLFVGGLGMLAATGVLSLSLAWWGLLLHSLLNTLFQPLAMNSFNALSFQAMGPDGRARRHEYMVAREIPLGVGRLLVGAGFLLLEPRLALLGSRALVAFLLVVGATFLAAWAVLRPLGRLQPTVAD